MNIELLKSQITEYSEKNAYVAEHFAISKCVHCECAVFTVVMNENEGVAARICTSCNAEQGIGDSDDLIDEVEAVYPIECRCGNDTFEILSGVSLYAESEEVRWFYLGCECSRCNLSGVYGDWKNEFNDFRVLLSRV